MKTVFATLILSVVVLSCFAFADEQAPAPATVPAATSAAPKVPVQGPPAEWIWFPEGDPVKTAPAGARFFRKMFDLPESIIGAWLWVSADDAYEAFLNGKQIGEGKEWAKPGFFNVKDNLKTGPNVLAIKATNTGGSAGLIAALRVIGNDRKEISVVTDASWKATTVEQPDWTSATFNEAAQSGAPEWQPAKSLGAAPLKPWESVGPLQLLSIKVWPQLITPNGDGVNDTVHISFTYPPGNPGRVEIRVVDPHNVPVQTFVANNKTEDEFDWDGKYDTGAGLGADKYTVIVMAMSKNHQAQASAPLEAKTVAPWPRPENTVKNFFPIGAWYDGRVEGINCPEGCNDVPNGLDNARKYYESTFKDIKQHGMDVITVANTPPEYRRTLLEVADLVGVRVILEVAELADPAIGGILSIRAPQVEQDEMKLFQDLSKVIRPLRGHKSLLAYQLIDEPSPDLFPKWHLTSRLMSAIDADHPAFSCLCTDEAVAHVNELDAQMLCFDRYPLTQKMKPGEYDFKAFISLLDSLKANAKGIPYWMVLQAFECPDSTRYPTPEELRLMTYLSLAHDAKGIFYFLYNSKTQEQRLEGLVNNSLKPEPIYDVVAKLARELQQLRAVLLTIAPIENTITGEGPVDVQMFSDPEGKKYVFINNLDVTKPIQFVGHPRDTFVELENLATHDKIELDTTQAPKFTIDLPPGHGGLFWIKE